MRHIFAALSLLVLSMTTTVNAQDIEAGEKVFKKCSACHQVGDDAKHKAGPILNNIIGRQIASADGYTKYSKDLAAYGETGAVWDAESINGWIADPKKYLREQSGNDRAKTRMSFKLKDATDRENVIAYLAQFSSAINDDTQSVDMNVNKGNNQLCVVNASKEKHFFTVEVKNGERLTASLNTGDALCSSEMTKIAGGVVSVFEQEDAFEGCSRLISAEQVAAGYAEEMRKYAEFDRCLWTSNDK